MLLEHVCNGQVGHDVAAGQHHIVLADLLQIGVYPRQGIHASLVIAVPSVGVSKGGQDAQSAVLAGEIPVLARSHVIQQGLVAGVDDEAHVGHAGVDQIGEHEVNDAVAPPIGHGAGIAVLGELPQGWVGAVGENNAMQLVAHCAPPPFTSLMTMAPGGTTAEPSTWMFEATTVIGGLPPVPGPPTWAWAPITARSATMVYSTTAPDLTTAPGMRMEPCTLAPSSTVTEWNNTESSTCRTPRFRR